MYAKIAINADSNYYILNAIFIAQSVVVVVVLVVVVMLVVLQYCIRIIRRAVE